MVLELPDDPAAIPALLSRFQPPVYTGSLLPCGELPAHLAPAAPRSCSAGPPGTAGCDAGAFFTLGKSHS